jgi:hypothetical protein
MASVEVADHDQEPAGRGGEETGELADLGLQALERDLGLCWRS